MSSSDVSASVEERLAALEAVAAIERLKHRYWRACDRKDVAGFRACFVASGADIDFERMGRYDDADGLADVFARVALRRDEAGRHLVLDMHHGLHPDITIVDRTSATGRWTLRFRQLDLRARTEKVAAVEYDDAYVVEDGEWRISRCVARTLWLITRPLPEDVRIEEAVA
ncbi:nuclear transport factor 2 family protein [Geodermatophilus marinus]|uniref:nuclear transport factor 2 family protein n=1 Tax=Geodermatophilus sp. LHW52908 TaxID=2303986 RepID=UPI000E3CA141|nr:nuclear transport factor 2 family protein [Geodermatophilus sp. LHW52908]RFU20514.1 nuclear transport factor 2 family protein [Geodermatophilus sp. LHW52908]